MSDPVVWIFMVITFTVGFFIGALLCVAADADIIAERIERKGH